MPAPSPASYTPLDVLPPGLSQSGDPPPPPPSATFSASSRDGDKTEIGLGESHCSGCQCGEDPKTQIPTYHHKKGGAFFGVKHSRPQASQPDHKCREDPPYQEMGESANLWNTYLNESAKVDADKVSNWTDALDVLLVFAGLFSAVVTTFVCQTYQNLQVDNSEIAVYLLYELVDIGRAISEGVSARDVPASPLTPNTVFRPFLSARWINSLWFMSLVLSLTTALIAVLTKQWIHEYVDSTQIGSLRARSRVRQFRFINLEEWHVPVIIGLLPVMMHVALGAFLAGLIVFLLSLDYIMAGAISIVVAGALMWYIITNILPVYDPSCPYRTPLTAYVYALSYYIHCLDVIPPFMLDLVRRIKASHNTNFIAFQSDEPPLEMPGSLREAERILVDGSADQLDAKAAGWLYNISSNVALQSEIIQSISNLTLRGSLILNSLVGVGRLETAIGEAFRAPELDMPAHAMTLDRLSRALILVAPENSPPRTPAYLYHSQPPSVTLLLEGSPLGLERAGHFLRDEIVNSSMELDVVVWTQILRNALCVGTEWLKFEREDLDTWRYFVGCFLQPRTCSACISGRSTCTDSATSLYTLCIVPRPGCQMTGSVFISTHDDSDIGTVDAITFGTAIGTFLAPSLSKLIFDRYYVSTCHSSLLMNDIPAEFRLQLALVQSSFIQRTSGSNESLFAATVKCIRDTLGVEGVLGVYVHYQDIPGATFHSLEKVITHDLDTLCVEDQRAILPPFFRAILLDTRLYEPYRCWISVPHARRILDIVFSHIGLLDVSLVADMMEVAVAAQCSTLLPMLYSRLRERDWLKKRNSGDRSLTGWEIFCHSFLVAAYIDGMALLKVEQPTEYGKTITYLQHQENITTLCQILALSDRDRL